MTRTMKIGVKSDMKRKYAMARKSYDQRLKERWLKQQQETDMHIQRDMHRIERMMNNLRPVRGLIMALCKHK